MSELKQDVRPGAVIPCPRCKVDLKYAVLTNHAPPTPFFYSTGGRSVLLRQSDEKMVEREMIAGATEADKLHPLWQKFLENAPPAPDGGRFEFWANVRCPHCGYEFPYNNGIKNVALRIFEPKIIVVDGATLVGDSDAKSWIVRVQTKS